MVNSILLHVKNFSYKWIERFKKLSLKKKIVYVFIAVILLIVIFQIFKTIIKKPSYTTAKVEKSSITETVSETGSIIASGKINVYSPTDGVIENVRVNNNDDVIEGQELFSVQSSATEQEQQSAYSTYLTAQAILNAAKSNLNVLRSAMYSNWDTFRSLATGDNYETGDNAPKEKERLESPDFQIASDNWLAAEAKYKDQQTVVSQTQAQVSSAWFLYNATQNAIVKAPTNGTVVNLAVSKGSSVNSKSITGLTTVRPALALSKSSVTEAVASLSETDIAKVKSGQSSKVEVNATDKIYNGIVRRVDAVGTENQGVMRYNVYIELTDADEKLRSGMTADAVITTNKIDDVLSVPNSAVKPYKGGRAVRIPQTKDKTIYIPVVIGIRGNSRTQILKGLTEGQDVVTSLSNEQIKRPSILGS